MKPFSDVVGAPRGVHARSRANSTRRITWALVHGFAQRLAGIGRREFNRALARRRMNRVRRNTAGVVTRMRSATSILILCHGNIIRSAFAHRLIAEGIDGATTVSIRSAGLGAVPGGPAHSSAIRAAGRRGVDLTTHVSARVAPHLVANADVIFVMDIDQVIEMQKRYPHARARTFLLTCLTADGPLEIRDPYDRDESVFETCFDDITRAVRPIVGTLRGTRRPRAGELA